MNTILPLSSGGKGQKQKQIFKECNDITSVNKCQVLILMVLLF